MMLDKSYHQLQVESFMLRAGQSVPVVPTIPTEEERIRMVKLVFEEAMELAQALQVEINISSEENQDGIYLHEGVFNFFNLLSPKVDLPDVADACCDLRVVTTCVLSGCGIPDAALQMEVDNNNLKKFGPGGYRREDGKWMKPPNHQPPRIAKLLDAMFPGCLG